MQLASLLSRQVLVRADVHAVVYGVSCFPSSLFFIALLLFFFSFECILLVTAAWSSSSAGRSGVPLPARCSSASPAVPFGRQVNDACTVFICCAIPRHCSRISTVLLVRCNRRTFSPLRFVVRMVPVRRSDAPMECAPCSSVQPETAPNKPEVGARWPTSLGADSSGRRWPARHRT